jgi:hypothetical protein
MRTHARLERPRKPQGPITYGLRVPKTGTVADIKALVRTLTGTPKTRGWLIVELAMHRMYKIHPDDYEVSDIREDDVIWAFEFPAHDAPPVAVDPKQRLVPVQLQHVKAQDKSTSSSYFWNSSKAETFDAARAVPLSTATHPQLLAMPRYVCMYMYVYPTLCVFACTYMHVDPSADALCYVPSVVSG